MGTVTALFESRVPRVPNANRRPCACPDCRRCATCKQLIAAGAAAATNCSFPTCPMRNAPTIADVMREFAKVVFAFPKPKPAPKK